MSTTRSLLVALLAAVLAAGPASAQTGGPEADVQLTVGAYPAAPLPAGLPFDVTLTVVNAGPDDATDTRVSLELLGAGGTVLDVGNPYGSVSFRDNHLTAYVGDLPPGATRAVTARLRPEAEGVLTTYAHAASSFVLDPYEGDNEVLRDTDVAAALADLAIVSLGAIPAEPFAAEPVSCGLVVRNRGPAALPSAVLALDVTGDVPWTLEEVVVPPGRGGPVAGSHDVDVVLTGLAVDDGSGAADVLVVVTLVPAQQGVIGLDAALASALLDTVPGNTTASSSWPVAPARVSVAGPAAPPAVVLLPNVPNPFNPVTRLRFALGRKAPVRLEIFDARGRRVRTLLAGDVLEAGVRSVPWDGRDGRGRSLAAGTYLWRVQALGGATTGRATLLK